jgi:hypothetical protein
MLALLEVLFNLFQIAMNWKLILPILIFSFLGYVLSTAFQFEFLLWLGCGLGIVFGIYLEFINPKLLNRFSEETQD